MFGIVGFLSCKLSTPLKKVDLWVVFFCGFGRQQSASNGKKQSIHGHFLPRGLLGRRRLTKDLEEKAKTKTAPRGKMDKYADERGIKPISSRTRKQGKGSFGPAPKWKCEVRHGRKGDGIRDGDRAKEKAK